MVRNAGYGDYYFVYGSSGTFSIAGILLRGIFYRGSADQRSCDTCLRHHYTPGPGAVATGVRLARYRSNPQHAGRLFFPRTPVSGNDYRRLEMELDTGPY